MAAGRNKVLLELRGRPLLQYSFETFRACCSRLVIVAASGELEAVRQLLPDVTVVAGGGTRHGSEWNGLQALRSELAGGDIVAIHDAARPLVSADDVAAVFAAAEAYGAALLARPCVL